MPIVVNGANGPTPLHFGRDDQGYCAYAPYFPANRFSATLTVGANVNLTVPSSASKWVAVFSYVGSPSVWVTLNSTTSQVPTGPALVPTNSILNPAALSVNAGDVINVVTTNATDSIGIALYANQ